MLSSCRSDLVKQIVDSIRSLLAKQSLVLVAIDGPGGAGKSTLASQLRVDLNAAVVAIDDFYRVMNETVRFNLTREQAYMQNFDWQRLRRQVLIPLRQNEPARYQRYDWPTGKLGNILETPPGGCVLVEGVGSYRPELRSFYDYAVYVDAPADICRTRLIQRGHNNDHWIDKWTAAENWYAEHHNPLAAADIVISGYSP